MGRIPQIDGLRAVAILMVFTTHALHIPLLWMGVDLFFVLSGYLITGILLRLKDQRGTGGNYWKPFYFRRVRRILPPYLGFLIFLTIFFHPSWTRIWYWYAFFGANLALALGKVEVAAMTPLWSLAVEEQFYFVWPWIVLLCSPKTLRRICVAVIVCSPILRALCTPAFATHFPIYSLTIFRADTLAAGAFIAVSERENARWVCQNQRLALWSIAAMLALLGLLSVLPNFRTGANSVLFNSIGYSLSVGLFGSILIFVLGIRQGFFYNVLTTRSLRFMGVISYTFYLYFVAILLKVDVRVHSTALVVVSAFVITCLISAASWFLVESRILNARGAV
jgi:peptidoglycan/LPS O-acetylase OafA/YrhL